MLEIAQKISPVVEMVGSKIKQPQRSKTSSLVLIVQNLIEVKVPFVRVGSRAY